MIAMSPLSSRVIRTERGSAMPVTLNPDGRFAMQRKQALPLGYLHRSDKGGTLGSEHIIPGSAEVPSDGCALPLTGKGMRITALLRPAHHGGATRSTSPRHRNSLVPSPPHTGGRRLAGAVTSW